MEIYKYLNNLLQKTCHCCIKSFDLTWEPKKIFNLQVGFSIMFSECRYMTKNLLSILWFTTFVPFLPTFFFQVPMPKRSLFPFSKIKITVQQKENKNYSIYCEYTLSQSWIRQAATAQVKRTIEQNHIYSSP